KPSGAKPAGTPASVEPVAPASTGTPRSMTPLSTKAGPPAPAAERPREPPPVARPAEPPRAAHPAAPQPSVPTPGPITRSDLPSVSAPPRERRPGPAPERATLTPAAGTTPRRPARSMPVERGRGPSAGPSRALVIGSAAVLAGLLLAAGAFVAFKKL